jgi:hypothetical protein
MKLLRKTVLPIAIALLHLIVLIHVKGMRYRRLRVKSCRFYGPSEFVEMCQSAMEDLENRDPVIYRALSSEHYLFWYDPKRSVDFEKHFSVKDSFRAWGSIGIVTFLVYAFYKTSAFSWRVFSLSDHSEANAAHAEVCEKTWAWLAKNSFPQKLIDHYESRRKAASALK